MINSWTRCCFVGFTFFPMVLLMHTKNLVVTHAFRPFVWKHRSFSTVPWASRWHEGDIVIPRKSGPFVEPIRKGKIVESRGSGWYEVCWDGKESTEKIRGTELRPQAASNEPKAANHATSNGTAIAPSLKTNEKSFVLPLAATIDDLDVAMAQWKTDPSYTAYDSAYFEQVHHHSSFKTWVVFTDLHCSQSTLQTTLQVLDRVHKLARERKAGVLFLGDWWHQRGTLRVDCLNAVLGSLKNWTVPMVLIPGNHDQISLGGENHGLTALENAYRVVCSHRTVPGPLIFSRPTKFHGALFVPHIRQNVIMESVLQSSEASSANAIFVHADVTGAYMNDLLRSEGGVPPSMFPSGKNIYSGHFHKPHLVGTKAQAIEYLGSPYQISLSEAQQDKALVVLDASENWKIQERIPLDLGCKHFRADGLEHFLSIWPRATSLGNVTKVDPGDRVVAYVSARWMKNEKLRATEGDDNALERHSRVLRAAGVQVEVRETGDTSTPSNQTSAWEELSAESTWRSYVEDQVNCEALTQETSETVLECGLGLLESLEENSTDSSMRIQSKRLDLTSLTVEGFGPFRRETNYPLYDRGLVLLRGSNRDGGSDSNGSGKTTLAVATLWALTGTLDSRPLIDLKVADVINDNSKTARVVLHGRVNGVDFALSRTKTAKGGSLLFLLDGQDLSAQSAKETQAIVEDTLGISSLVLSRSLFHGQHAIGGLLEAADARFKDELSMVVPLELWKAGSTLARKKARLKKSEEIKLEGMMQLRAEDVKKIASELQNSEQNLNVAENALHVAKSHENHQGDLDASQSRISELQTAISSSEEARDSALIEREAEINPLKKECDDLQAKLNHLVDLEKGACRDLEVVQSKQEQTSRSLNETQHKWGVALTGGVPPNFALPEKCPTCHRGLPGSNEAALQEAREEMNRVVNNRGAVAAQLVEVARELDQLRCKRNKLEKQLGERKHVLAQRSGYWDERIGPLDTLLSDQQTELHDLFSELASFAARMELDAMKTRASRSFAAVEATKSVLEKLQNDHKSLLDELQDVRRQRDQAAKENILFSDISKAMGPKGIQTFVLQSAVSALEAATQHYLNDLSDGSIRLQLNLDHGDGVSKTALVRAKDGTFTERPLAALSGGQWRRCSLALTFGFVELLAERAGFRSSLCVLDEPLTHLDRAGRTNVGNILRKLVSNLSSTSSSLSFSTVMLILQDLAAEEIEEVFDHVDEVVRNGDESFVVVDGHDQH